MTNKEFGALLARKLFETGSWEGEPCTRIQFKAGRRPYEKDLAGFGEKPLADWIAETLDVHGLSVNGEAGR